MSAWSDRAFGRVKDALTDAVMDADGRKTLMDTNSYGRSDRALVNLKP